MLMYIMSMVKPAYYFLLLLVFSPLFMLASYRESPQPAKIYSAGKISYVDGATRIIDLIMETIGLEASFEVKKARVPNAAAVMYQGRRYILYNPAFIVAMNRAAGSPWAAVAVLAHEIGHHLNGHTLDGKGSLPAIELEADEFSGFVLRKMGASLPEAQLAMRIIATARATRTHPGRDDRLMAIADGWNKADDQVNNGNIARKNAPPITKPGEETVLASRYIAFDVHFNFDPHTRYHVTVKNNLVKLLDDHLEVLGKLLVTGKTSYPLAFQTSSEDFLLVNDKGKIFSKHGETVGYLVPRR